MWKCMVDLAPFTDPFTAATNAPRSFHVVGNASETVCKAANSMCIYVRSQSGPYTLHGVNKRPPIRVWVVYGSDVLSTLIW